MKKIYVLATAISLALVFSSAYATKFYNTKDVAKFEKTNKCPGCDLSDATLSQNHSGAMLSNANLSNINMYGDEGKNVRINLSDANLTNANLSGANLTQANFSGADLTGAHLDGAYVAAANFYGAKGVDLSRVHELWCVILPNGETSKC